MKLHGGYFDQKKSYPAIQPHTRSLVSSSNKNLTLLAYLVLSIVYPLLIYRVHAWAVALVVVVAKITFWPYRGKIPQDSLVIILP